MAGAKSDSLPYQQRCWGHGDVRCAVIERSGLAGLGGAGGPAVVELIHVDRASRHRHGEQKPAPGLQCLRGRFVCPDQGPEQQHAADGDQGHGHYELRCGHKRPYVKTCVRHFGARLRRTQRPVSMRWPVKHALETSVPPGLQ